MQILALFETSTHPEHTKARADTALKFVDRIITAASLHAIDMDDPEVCVYQPRRIPLVTYPDRYERPAGCGCVRGATHSPPTDVPPERYSYSFSFNPPWDPLWSDAEKRREECRRICWSALNLIANYTAQCAAFHEDPLDLRLMEPANVSRLSRLPVAALVAHHR